MKNKNPSFTHKRNKNLLIPLIIIFLATSLICFSVFYFFYGRYQKNPEVETMAENCYNETLHVVTDKDYEPFSYIDEDGEYAGMDVEMINEISNRLHMNLDLRLLDWTEANELFSGGNADAILNMETDIVTNSPDIISTIPTIEKQYVVYGHEKVNSVADLYGRRIVSMHSMQQLGLDDEISYMDSYSAIFTALKNNEYDYAICPIQVGNVFLHKMNIRNISPSYAVSHVYGAIALSAENTSLRKRLNEVISTMEKEGLLEELDRKWISDRYQNITIQEFIQNHPALGGTFITFIFLFTFLITLLAIQKKTVQEREEYAQNLQEQLSIINKQSEELKEANERIEASSKAKTTFLFNMSHDIRTPMNAIIGYVKLSLQEKDIPAVLEDYLRKIDSSSQHLLALINDVLEMSRIESGKMDLEPVPVDLKKLLTDLEDIFSTQMKTKNISFSLDVSEIKHNNVLCDKNRINRVFLNLISNAYKFTPEGGKVSVLARELDSDSDLYANYEIHVKDNGIGMSEEFTKKIFDAFERERNSTVSGIQGTGLGMSITKKIVDLMNGKIEVNTRQGKGTEFILYLTFRLNSEALSETMIAPAASSDESEKSIVDFSDKRLLLVEDVEINREIALMMLEDLGFSVETAENGQKAFNIISESEPGYFDAILMDIQMPVMDGYEATAAIRRINNKELSSIPIIAMTANAFSEDVAKAREAGMNAHIAKPIDAEVISKTLRSIFLISNCR